MSYRLSGGLSAEQIRDIYVKAKELLFKMGMTIGGKVGGVLNGRPGYQVCGDVIRISPERVDECVEAAKSKFPDEPQEEWELELLSSYPIYDYDFRTRKHCLMTTDKVVELTKLADVLFDKGVRGSTPGVPQDVPPGLRHLMCLLIGARYSRFGPDAPISSPETAQWMLPMLEVAGKEPNFGLFILNPLCCEGNTLDTLAMYPDRFKTITVGSMPMMGLTAPIDLIGATILAIAAALGAMSIAMEFAPAAKYYLEPRVWAMNFLNMSIEYGSPETTLSAVICDQFLREFGLECGGSKAFHSSAVMPDAQANGQRGACGLVDALNGVRKFTFGGLLATDMVFSAHQLLFDIELISYYKKVCDGFSFDTGTQLEKITAVGPAGDYLGEEDTLKECRNVWSSRLWDFSSIDSFLNGTGCDIMDRASEQIEKLIGTHEYNIDAIRLKELNKIYESSKKHLS